MRELYFALGDEKWREGIDMHEHHYGRMVYDECLHGDNNGKAEPGFISSIEAAQTYVGTILGTKTTLEQWMTAHKFATQVGTILIYLSF